MGWEISKALTVMGNSQPAKSEIVLNIKEKAKLAILLNQNYDLDNSERKSNHESEANCFFIHK